MREDYAAAEIASLIEADLKTSGAKTALELRGSLISSVLSLMDQPRTTSDVMRTGRNEIEMIATISMPRLPGDRR